MPTSNLARILLATAALTCSAAAVAQEQVTPLASGQQLMLASYYELSSTGCSVLSPPRVTITQQPALGKLIVVRAKGLVRNSSPKCALGEMDLPLSQLWYQANKPGVDTMAWSVTFQARVAPRDSRPRMEYGSARLRVKPRPAD